MTFSLNLLAILLTVATGAGVLSANPSRAINRAFAGFSAYVVIWLFGLARLTTPNLPNPIAWLHFNNAIGAFFPWLLWILKNCAAGEELTWSRMSRGWPWFVSGILLTILVYSPYFIPPGSTKEKPLYAWGSSAYVLVTSAEYLIILVQTTIDLRKLQGINRVELQTLLLGGTAAGLFGSLLSEIAHFAGSSNIQRSLLPLLIVAFYAATAFGITTRKVFDAKHLFQEGLRRIGFMSMAAAVLSFGIYYGLQHSSAPAVIILCTGAMAYIFHKMDSRLGRTSLLGGSADVAIARNAILTASREAVDVTRLQENFTAILTNWARAEHSYIFQLNPNGYSSGLLQLEAESMLLSVLRSEGWATPESLQRQRGTRSRDELARYMKQHRLGVLAVGPHGEADYPLILGIGVRHDRRPFIWPEIQLLQEWLAVMEGAFSRVVLSQHARDAEQLATAGLLGASLAHEIRNPLVSIKLIVQSAAVRYNDPSFRRLLVELIPGEIERIEGLVTGLMDLGRPHHAKFEPVHLNEVVRDSYQLVQAKAEAAAVTVHCRTDATYDNLSGDKAGLKQVVLNLVMNAIEAVTLVPGLREVSMRTAGDGKSVVLDIADNGPGIPPEIRQRLFRPFTTMNKTTGMGLGLAITAEIVRSHRGTITFLDEERAGTTFRVTLPCQQPSS